MIDSRLSIFVGRQTGGWRGSFLEWRPRVVSVAPSIATVVTLSRSRVGFVFYIALIQLHTLVIHNTLALPYQTVPFETLTTVTHCYHTTQSFQHSLIHDALD
jgi:hypothetical protein